MKIVGMILLVLLLIIVTLVLLILFVPIRYRIEGKSEDAVLAIVHVSYLLHFVRFRLEYLDKQLDYRLWIGFIPVSLGKKEHTKSDDSEEQTEQTEQSDTLAATTDETLPENQNLVSESEVSEEELSQTEQVVKPAPKNRKQKNKASQKIEALKQKFHRLRHNIRKYKRMLTDERNHAAVSFLKDQLIRLLKTIMPDRLKLTASFSTGSPDTTGELLGVLAMFPIGYRNRWNIYPDFEAESTYVRGNIDVKGKILMIQLLVIALKVFFNKDCKRLYKMLTR